MKTKKNVKYGSGYRGMFGFDRTSDKYCYPFKYVSLKNAIVNYAKRLLSIDTDDRYVFKYLYYTWYNEEMARIPVTNLIQYGHFTAKWGDISRILRVLDEIDTDDQDLVDDFKKLLFYFRNKIKQSNFFRSSYDKCKEMTKEADLQLIDEQIDSYILEAAHIVLKLDDTAFYQNLKDEAQDAE